MDERPVNWGKPWLCAVSGHPIPSRTMRWTSPFTFWALVVLSPLAAAGVSHGSHDEVAPAKAGAGLFLKIRDALSGVGSRTEADCYYILGLSKFSWAFICDLLALAVVLLCIPLLLSCSKRRPLGASMFEFKICSSPTDSSSTTGIKTTFSSYHSFQMN
eukprot:Skav227333  [mRNA]  locus=scaffold4115:19328:22931:- [translate_table: standard]